MGKSKAPRIEWIDAAKGIGCVLIFLSHMGTEGGRAYGWVVSFHVQLFFLLSGCLAIYNRRGVIENIVHKFITIMIPFYFFGVLSFLFKCITNDAAKGVGKFVKMLLKGGIRNQCHPAGALWFLTCLFSLEVMFTLIKKICRGNKLLVFIVCLLVHLSTVYIISPSPIFEPKLPYNIDSAGYYLIFYAVGWLVTEPLNKFMYSQDKKATAIRIITTLLAFYYSFRLYFGTDLLYYLSGLKFLTPEFHVFRAFISVYAFVMLSKYLTEYGHLKTIGVYSLYYCGNEYFARELIPMVLSIFGVTVTLSNPMVTILYVILMTELVYWVLTGLEKPLLVSLQKTATQWAGAIFKPFIKAR